jgi:hypothetical protein
MTPFTETNRSVTGDLRPDQWFRNPAGTVQELTLVDFVYLGSLSSSSRAGRRS